MAMMGNPQQMTITSDAPKSLGVPTDMMMSFPFGINLPSQGQLTKNYFNKFKLLYFIGFFFFF
jgi:hypothetical protein